MHSELPAICNYGLLGTGKGSANTIRVHVGTLTVWFSYQTPVAFMVLGSPKVVRQNDWAQTTGKHLNWIDGGDKESRVDSATFERLWAEQVMPMFDYQTTNA